MKKIIPCVVFLFISVTLFAQLKQGEVDIGGTGGEVGNSIVQCKDGGYIVAGLTGSFGAGGIDVYIVKLDPLFALQWTKVIGGKGNDFGYSIIQSSDGGFALVGATHSFGDVTQDSADIYVVKLDSVGNVKWTRTIGGSGDDVGNSIIQTKDGSYIIAGYTNSFGAGGYDAYVIKLDTAGNIKWTRTVGGAKNDEGSAITLTNDGGYAITGWTGSFGAGTQDVYLIKLDSTGGLQWTRTIGSTSDEAGNFIIQTEDKGYAITGYADSTGLGAGVYIMKLDSLGNLKWRVVVNDTNSADTFTVGNGYSIQQTNDSGYIISGYTYAWSSNNTIGVSGLRVMKLDSLGDLKWNKGYGGTNVAWVADYPLNVVQHTDVIQTIDGGYAATWLNGPYAYHNMYIIKLDTAGDDCSVSIIKPKINKIGGVGSGGIIGSGGGITTVDSGKVTSGGTLTNLCSVITSVNEKQAPINAISVSPNPSNGIFQLTINNYVPMAIGIGIKNTVEVYNVLGEKVYDGTIQLQGDNQIDLRNEPSGIYFVRVYNQDQKFIATTKIIIE